MSELKRIKIGDLGNYPGRVITFNVTLIFTNGKEPSSKWASREVDADGNPVWELHGSPFFEQYREEIESKLNARLESHATHQHPRQAAM